MRISSSARRAFAFLVFALAGAVPASAQNGPKAEISAGYQVLGLKSGEDDLDETLGKGWYADLAGNIGNYFAVVDRSAATTRVSRRPKRSVGSAVRSKWISRCTSSWAACECTATRTPR